MQIKQLPTRLEFTAQERNAAQRAILRLITDFGLKIEADKRVWSLPLGDATARIALEISALEESIASPLNANSVCLKAVNPSGAKLLEMLYTNLRREWQDTNKGPTHQRRTVNREQAAAVLRILS
jgi:hypothetical protein